MEKSNLNIFGSGSSGGGEFDKVKIKGEGTITDDLVCNECKTHGSNALLGDIKTGILAVYGTSEMDGSIKAREMKVYGTLSGKGDIYCNSTKVKGSLEAGGNTRTGTTDIKGSLAVQNDCEAEKFYLDGSFEIGGLLNADEIKIEMRFGESHAAEIGGEHIQIKRKSAFLGIHKSSGRLTTEQVEGDHIYLEYTTAKTVRGKTVEIGPGCEIERIEYKEYIKKDKGSKIMESIRV